MDEIWTHNECLNTWHKRSNSEDVPAYVKQLRQSSVLGHTRSFVAWYAIPNGNQRERFEIARGEA